MTRVFNTSQLRFTIAGKAVWPFSFTEVDETDPKAAALIAAGSLVVQEPEPQEPLVPEDPPKDDPKTKTDKNGS